ncbi:MAG: DNA gyrase inhibitor YacG [Acetobacter sp.]|nr:DNA gyrase inhibitor YacG [Acetobacter sp.]
MIHPDLSEPLPRSTCPLCQKPTVVAFRPFCSRRCADIDLGRWLSEEYRIPSTENLPPPLEEDIKNNTEQEYD